MSRAFGNSTVDRMLVNSAAKAVSPSNTREVGRSCGLVLKKQMVTNCMIRDFMV